MSRNRRNSHCDLSGMLLLDKPAGITSNGALQRVKALLEVKKAGHTGSLDPVATGLLPLCFGDATKVSSFFLGADKRYWTRLKLGESTDTGDSEGRVVQRRAVRVADETVDGVLAKFVGEIDQVPPMYSAIKKNGQPLYKLAREGIEIEREPRRVHVYRLRNLGRVDEYLELDMRCSSGFYVRALAEDIGELLGCGAHVVALRRLEVGHLNLEDAVTLAHLESLDDVASRRALLLPIDRGLAHLPEVKLSVDAAFYLCRGQAVRAADLPSPGWVRLYSKDVGFLGLGAVLDDGRVAPKRLFVNRPARRSRVVAQGPDG